MTNTAVKSKGSAEGFKPSAKKNNSSPNLLTELVFAQLSTPSHPVVGAFAERVAARHGAAAEAVLFYGSALRTGDLSGTLLDFYVLVDSYRRAYGAIGLAIGNRLVPPNVFYAEEVIDGITYRAKYAVLSLEHFRHLASARCFNVSVWARFAQPSQLAWAREGRQDIFQTIAAAVAQAPATLLRAARPMLPASATVRDLWVAAFALTYGSELRAEKKGKGLELFDLAPDYYLAITAPALEAAGIPAAISGDHVQLPAATSLQRLRGRLAWSLRSLQGKLLSVLRLIKATATFTGGIDYLAWKITRHSGVPVEIKPWHRRHPILGGLFLFRDLKRKGAIR